MQVPKQIGPSEALKLATEWAEGAPLGDLAIRYLGYSASDPLGTRACATHRYLRALFDHLGYAQRSLAELRKSFEQVRPLLERLSETESLPASSLVEKACDPAESWIDTPSSRGGSFTTGERKILVLSDLHIPFHHLDMIDWALRRESDAQELVLLGDLWDMYAASRFVKNRQIDVLEEIEIGYALLVEWLSAFPKVVVVTGNHDTRPARLVAREHPEVLPLVFNPIEYVKYQLVSSGRLDLLERLVTPQYLVRGSHPERPVKTDFLYLVGDAILGHFEVSRKGPATTVYRLAMEWLPVWGPLVGATDVRVIVQGHVHRLSKAQYGKTTIIESGCCSHVLDYTVTSPLSYTPPGVGYVVLYQVDGVTDVNRSGYYCYDLYTV